LGRGVKPDVEVIETRYHIGNIHLHQIRRADQPPIPEYDMRALPKLYFFAAACMTLLTLVLVRRELPDIYLRTRLWFRWLRRATLEVYGMHQLPDNGPVILATNATHMQSCLQILTSTDRMTRFFLVEHNGENWLPPVLRLLVSRYSIGVIAEADLPGDKYADDDGPADWAGLLKRADETLAKNEVVGISVDDPLAARLADPLLSTNSPHYGAPILPVYYEVPDLGPGRRRKHVYVVVGAPLPPGTPREEVSQEIQRVAAEFKEQHRLGKQPQPNAVGSH